MMSLLGVKYILESKKGQLKDKQPTETRFPPEMFTRVWENSAWRIWQYTRALPRVMFATSYIVRRNPQQIIDALYDRSVRLNDTIVLEHMPPVPNGQTYLSNEAPIATLISYDLNRVVISTVSPVDGFVLLTDNYYPGWTATIDGKSTEIYRADYTLRAVAVAKGNHTVIFLYSPESFTVGAIVTGFGVLMSASVIIYMKRNTRYQKKKSNHAYRYPQSE